MITSRQPTLHACDQMPPSLEPADDAVSTGDPTAVPLRLSGPVGPALTHARYSRFSDRLAAERRAAARAVHPSADWCSPHGIPRPTGDAA